MVTVPIFVALEEIQDEQLVFAFADPNNTMFIIGRLRYEDQ